MAERERTVLSLAAGATSPLPVVATNAMGPQGMLQAPLRRPLQRANGLFSGLLLALIGLTGAALEGSAHAGPVIRSGQGTTAPRSCPALLPANESFLEPMRLPPSEVPAKNAKGCLSPADAIYGPDGCPKQLCPQPAGYGL